ncbi:17755_t:CDS:2 [Entrophospora sp. SA101]|nr:17755_t:CDS:2 [Entrophospora sp. SA101]
MSSSHLHTSQKNDNNNINTNERYYCYRHKLDLKRNSMNSNESTMLENLQQTVLISSYTEIELVEM